MKYKVGDRVRIKSLDWYNRHTNGTEVDYGAYPFTSDMKEFCGQERIIANVCQECYLLLGIDDKFVFTDEMIEGLVKEETKPNIIEEAKTYWDSIKDAWICPEGYIFKDENGNVINATKIVLEKKKKEYPKTFEECLHVLEGENRMSLEQMNTFRKLIDARNAYWKLYGEEMGLGKPWEPNDADYITGRYCIFVHQGSIICSTPAEDCSLTFPTEEMRDAFYENFKELIEQCKELL